MTTNWADPTTILTVNIAFAESDINDVEKEAICDVVRQARYWPYTHVRGVWITEEPIPDVHNLIKRLDAVEATVIAGIIERDALIERNKELEDELRTLRRS